MWGTWELLLVSMIAIGIAFIAVARSKQAELKAVRVLRRKLVLEQINNPESRRPMLRGKVDGVQFDILWMRPPAKKWGTVTQVVAEFPGLSSKRLDKLCKRAKKNIRLPMMSSIEPWKGGLLVTVNANVGPEWEVEKLIKVIKQLAAFGSS